MKVTDNSTYRLMQTNLDRITNDMLVLRNQGATGLKLNKPSDDPGAIRPVLTTRTQLQQNERHQETIGHASDKMAATDGYLAQVENVLVRVKEITINSINGSMSESDMTTLANELAEIKNQLLDSANAVIDGKFIFAGFKEDTKPFTENPDYDPELYKVNDLTTWPYRYNGDHNTTELEITPGEFMGVNLTGNELFMGITNEIYATGSANPYQGETQASTTIGVGTPGEDIIITVETDPPASITIAGADLTDPVGEDNYAAKVAGLFNQIGTGLVGSASAASANLGPLTLTDFVASEDSYNLEISSGGDSISVSLDGSAGKEFTLTGMASTLANTLDATDLTPTGGTLSNGVTYDISSGSLVLTGPDDGSEIDLTETITDGTVTGTVPTGGITGGNQTIYGAINIATNSTTDVTLAGAGLSALGFSADTLNGSSGRIDLFTVLTRAEEAIRSGNIDDLNGPGGSIQAQLANLEIAADQNRSLRSNMGAKARRVESAELHQQDAEVDLKQILSRYQDADMIEVFNDIIQKETAFKAALNISARVSDISILDYF